MPLAPEADEARLHDEDDIGVGLELRRERGKVRLDLGERRIGRALHRVRSVVVDEAKHELDPGRPRARKSAVDRLEDRGVEILEAIRVEPDTGVGEGPSVLLHVREIAASGEVDLIDEAALGADDVFPVVRERLRDERRLVGRSRVTRVVRARSILARVERRGLRAAGDQNEEQGSHRGD